MIRNRDLAKKEVMDNLMASQWCYVNTDNEFVFMDTIFTIDKDVDEYRVYNRVQDTLEFTNESYMEEVLVAIDKSGLLKFYNQNFRAIDNLNISVKNN